MAASNRVVLIKHQGFPDQQGDDNAWTVVLTHVAGHGHNGPFQGCTGIESRLSMPVIATCMGGSRRLQHLIDTI